MEETGKAGKKSNIEINADKGAKQNSHPGSGEWPHLIRIGVLWICSVNVRISCVCCRLCENVSVEGVVTHHVI